VPVGGEGEVVEAVAGERAQTLEVRLHVPGERRLEIKRQHVPELPVDSVEILAMHVGRDVVRAVRARGAASVRHRSLL
jgi:hypothetical protein